MREHWNFNANIAMELENIAKDYYKQDEGRPFDKIYDADAIQNGSFIDVMLIMLYAITNYKNNVKDIDNFRQKALKYVLYNPNEIDKFEAENLFTKFKKLYKKYNKK